MYYKVTINPPHYKVNHKKTQKMHAEQDFFRSFVTKLIKLIYEIIKLKIFHQMNTLFVNISTSFWGISSIHRSRCPYRSLLMEENPLRNLTKS